MARIEQITKEINGVETEIYPVTIHQSVVDESNNETLDVTLEKKATHGYDVEETPKTLKEVDDSVSQLAGEVKQLIADYTHNSNIVLPQIESIDYSTSTITFTAPHGIASVPSFYVHACVAQINDFTIKTNYKAVPSGLQVEGSLKIVQIVSPTALRFSRAADGSNYVLPCAEPTFVDFTKWHLQYIPQEALIFNVLFESCVAVKIVVLARTQHGQPYFDIRGDETAVDNVTEVGTILGLGNAIIERTYWISGNGLVTVRTSGTGNTIRSTGLAKVTYDTINTWRYENMTFLNTLRCSNFYPTFCNGTRFLIYKLA